VVAIEGTLRVGQGEETQTIIHEHDVNLLMAETTDFPFPGFVQHIVGMKVGEEKSFELVVPETDEDEKLRGQTVHFTATLDDLKVRVVPPLDDALAQTVGDYETLDALRSAVRARLLQQATREAESGYADECLEKLVEQATIEFPSLMVEEEVDRLIERTERRLKDQRMSLDEFLNIKKQTRDDYRAELRPKAENNVRRGLAMSELAVREGLTVSRDEVTIAINMISAGYGQEADQVRESLSSDESRQSLSISLLSDKVIARLVSICKGESLSPPSAGEQAPSAETPAAEEITPTAESLAAAAEAAEVSASQTSAPETTAESH
jgi:trigger factor